MLYIKNTMGIEAMAELEAAKIGLAKANEITEITMAEMVKSETTAIERGKNTMALNKNILENVIKSGKFDLARATQLIESGYVAGDYSEEERQELLALRDQHLKPENQAPEMMTVLLRLEEKYAALEARVKALEGESGEADPGEEETYPAWEPWDGISSKYQLGDKVTHNGFVWESTYKGQNTWEPGALGTESLWQKAAG